MTGIIAAIDIEERGEGASRPAVQRHSLRDGGAAIAQVCRVNGTLFGVQRAISDKADGTAIDDFAVFSAQAAEKTMNILKYFVERKGLI